MVSCSVNSILKFGIILNQGPANYVAGSSVEPQALDASTLLSSFPTTTAGIWYKVCFISHSEISSLPLLATWAVGKNGKWDAVL